MAEPLQQIHKNAWTNWVKWAWRSPWGMNVMIHPQPAARGFGDCSLCVVTHGIATGLVFSVAAVTSSGWVGNLHSSWRKRDISASGMTVRPFKTSTSPEKPWKGLKNLWADVIHWADEGSGWRWLLGMSVTEHFSLFLRLCCFMMEVLGLLESSGWCFCGFWWTARGWEGIERPQTTTGTGWCSSPFWATQRFVSPLLYHSVIPQWYTTLLYHTPWAQHSTPSLPVRSCPGQAFELNLYYTVTWNCWRPDFLNKAVNQIWMMLNCRLSGLISAFSQDPNRVGPLRISKSWCLLLCYLGQFLPSFFCLVPAYLEAGNTNIPARLLNYVVH